MKKILALVLATMMVLSVMSFASAEEAVNITVFHYMAQATKQAGLDAIEAAYTAEHPNVTFTNIYYNQGTDYFLSCPPPCPPATSLTLSWATPACIPIW